MYNKLPIKERMDLMKSYRKANPDMSYRDMVNDYNTSYEKFGDGGKKSFNDWYKTVPANKADTSSYNLRRAYDLAPQEQLDAFVKNPNAHLYSTYENKETGVYEFMKSKNHPTIQKELEWFNSNDPEAIKFKNNYKLDTSKDYYQYVPQKHKYGGIQKFGDEGKSDGMTGMMKSKIATEAHYGNPAALRMVSPNPNKYTFTGKELDWEGNQASPAGDTGTHFMGSYGNQARPSLQEVNGKMQYFENPQYNSKENFNFLRPEDAEYFAEHYKDVAPMMRGYEKFGDGGKKSVNNNLLSTTVRNDNTLYNGQSFLNRGMQIEHYPNGVNDTLYNYTKQLPDGTFENFNSSTGHSNSPAFNQLYKNGQFLKLPPNQSTEYQNNILNYFQKTGK